MTHRTRRLGLVVAVAAGSALLAPVQHATAIPANAPRIGMVCTPPTTPNVYNLVASSGYTDTPDGNSVFMWSYANADAPDNGHFQLPGPVMCVTEGASVTVHLHNTLGEPVSIVFPGQDSAVTASGGTAGLLTQEAATNGDVTYTFTAGRPGTYLYESGSDVSKQIPMGLSGGLVVRPTLGANFAYDDAASRFDPAREYLLLVNEIDPFLHHAVEVGGTYDYNATEDHYFTINGREFPDTIQDNGSQLLPNQPYGALVRIQPDLPGSQPALIRMINAGALNHPFHPHGNHTTQIAQDGRELLSPTGASAGTEHFGETIGAGATEDFLLRWTDVDHWDPAANPFPVAQPNYRQLTFKDGNTWYSGTPYLGYKGTLPVGTVSQNICGEWYFPWHSHALNEFTNFDQGFGGMGTLLRVDPPGGCFASGASTAIVSGVLKSGSVTALNVADSTYYQVNPKTTTLTSSRNAVQTTLPVASAAGFPAAGSYYVRVDNEVMQVTGGQGTTTWTVARGQLGTGATAHGNAAVATALSNDWYTGFTGIPAGSQNLKITYTGKNCAGTTGTTCTALAAPLPQQTTKICNWTISGATGCSTATSNGWVTLPAPQSIAVGSTDVSTTWTLPGSGANYIGTGAYNGQVRVLVHTQRWTAPSPATFSTWGNLMKIVYDAP